MTSKVSSNAEIMVRSSYRRSEIGAANRSEGIEPGLIAIPSDVTS